MSFDFFGEYSLFIMCIIKLSQISGYILGFSLISSLVHTTDCGASYIHKLCKYFCRGNVIVETNLIIEEYIFYLFH